MNTFNFSGLSPDSILTALEACDIFPQSGLLALNSYENRVYQFQADDNSRWVVKFYRPQRWSDAQIQEEHDYALELQQHDIPVVAPQILHGKTLHHYREHRFALFPSVGGRQFEIDNLDQLEWAGRFLGRIHTIAKSNTFTHRPALDIQSHLHEPAKHLESSELLPDSLKKSFFAILYPVIEAVSALYRTESIIRLHGDCHPGNILWP